ncbi:MAG: hypothetical protein LBC13_02790, partial [Clostridiales bacterium]|nr:hypothetical protein [Clostridiales bacterium]
MDYKQLQDLKNQYKDCILFVRVGDFYEAFGEDAAVLSKELDLTLTGRDMANAAERVPMAGVPFHAVERYIARLIENGHKVAVAENMGESVSIKKPEIRERDADEEEEDYFDGWAKDVIRSGLKGVRNDNRADYLRARLIAANAFSGIINRDMSYFDASIVDPVSNRLYSEKALIKSMLSEISGAEDKAVQALYLKEIAERFSREISDDILEAYGWDRDNLYKNILEKSVTAPVRTVAENTDNTAAPKTVAAEASGGLTIKSQVEGLADWSTESLPQEARVAAEWLIRNGYENENDVKSAFYYRQTSDMSDYRYAKRNDDDAIASLAESYKKRAADARKAAIVRPSEGLRETRQQTTSQNQKTKNVGNDDALNGTAETKIKNVREDKKMNDGKIKNYEDDYPFFENGVSYENANAGKESHRLTPEDYIKQADADFIAAMREGRYPEIVNGIADLNYSLRNVMLIKSQMPEATKVMGMHAWNYQGRSVIGGQKSLKILAVSDGNEAGEYGEENRGGNTSGKSYRLSYDFDVSQTKGKALKDK